MYPSVLTLSFPNAGPEIRVFLIRYLWVFGCEKVQKEVKSIAAQLDVTVRVATTSLSYLFNNGYLSKRLFVSEKGDRASYYLFDPNLEQQLSGVENCRHQRLIDDLLTLDSGRRSKRRHALNLSCRLLMAILLNYADEFGIVEDLGLAELSKLTGMNKDRLDSNLAILKAAGYVRFHIAGITCGYLFGKRPRIYVLNIRHAGFTQWVKFCLTTIDPWLTAGDGGKTELDEANGLAYATLKRVRGRSNYINEQSIDRYRSILGCGDNFVQIMNFFRDQDRMYRSYFQVKLEKYASFLLSHHWKVLLESKVVDRDVAKDQLTSSIKSEVVYLRTGTEKRAKKENEEKKKGKFKGVMWVHPEVKEADAPADDAKMVEFSEEQYALLVDFVYTAGWLLAVRVQEMLISAHRESAYKEFLHKMTHRILPYELRSPHYLRLYTIVDSYLQDEPRSKSSYYLYKGKTVDTVSSLSLQDQYQYGLLTKPYIKTINKPAEAEKSKSLRPSSIP